MQQTVDDTPSLSQDYVLERLARAAYAWDCSLSGSAVPLHGATWLDTHAMSGICAYHAKPSTNG